MVRLLLACALALGLAGGAHALTAEQARAIAAGDSTEARIAALNQAVQTADARTAAFVDALANDAVKLAGGQVLVSRESARTTRSPAPPPRCRPMPRT